MTHELSTVCVCVFVIPKLGRLRQEDHEFLASPAYIVRFCLKKGNIDWCGGWEVQDQSCGRYGIW
jgi:hypothetical protein